MNIPHFQSNAAKTDFLLFSILGMIKIEILF